MLEAGDPAAAAAALEGQYGDVFSARQTTGAAGGGGGAEPGGGFFSSDLLARLRAARVTVTTTIPQVAAPAGPLVAYDSDSD